MNNLVENLKRKRNEIEEKLSLLRDGESPKEFFSLLKEKGKLNLQIIEEKGKFAYQSPSRALWEIFKEALEIRQEEKDCIETIFHLGGTLEGRNKELYEQARACWILEA